MMPTPEECSICGETYMQGDCMEKMKELFHKDNYNVMKYHVNQSQNILKRVINEISSIYKQPAVRTTDDERYQEILDSFDLEADELFKARGKKQLINQAVKDYKNLKKIVFLTFIKKQPHYITLSTEPD